MGKYPQDEVQEMYLESAEPGTNIRRCVAYITKNFADC